MATSTILFTCPGPRNAEKAGDVWAITVSSQFRCAAEILPDSGSLPLRWLVPSAPHFHEKALGLDRMSPGGNRMSPPCIWELFYNIVVVIVEYISRFRL